jgi:hypothetical protein
MTQDGKARAPGVVTALRRPPVRQSIVVCSGRRHTFETFVRTIGIWWPVTPFSVGRDQVRDVTFEQRQGGRVYETWQDGTRIAGCRVATSAVLTARAGLASSAVWPR